MSPARSESPHHAAKRSRTASIALAAACLCGSGCDFRDRRYDAENAPHASSDGLLVALLSFHEERGCLLCTIEVRNPSMSTFRLRCPDFHPTWCSLSWEDHRAAGIPAIEQAIPDGPLFTPIDVTDPLVMPPYSTQKFDVRFCIEPSLPSTRQPVSIVVEALDEVSREVRRVTVGVPTA